MWKYMRNKETSDILPRIFGHSKCKHKYTWQWWWEYQWCTREISNCYFYPPDIYNVINFYSGMSERLDDVRLVWWSFSASVHLLTFEEIRELISSEKRMWLFGRVRLLNCSTFKYIICYKLRKLWTPTLKSNIINFSSNFQIN